MQRESRHMTDRFVYGTHFFRVPNPPRELRRPLLEKIAREHEFNLVRIYPSWDYFNPAPGEYDLEQVEEVMTACDELGLGVLLGIVLETAPYWLERQQPDTRYVDIRGRPQVLGGSPAQLSGGWPGLCMDAPAVRAEAERFVRAIVQMAITHPSLHAYDVWNEPRLEPAASRDLYAGMPERLFCYCDHSIRAFRAWLRERYGSVEALNEAWVRRFSDFAEVEPPRFHGTYADWVDWRRFCMDRQTGQMAFRVGILREEDPGRLIESHTAHCPPMDDGSHAVLWATDPWALAEQCDVWGASLFPGVFPTAPLALDAQRLDIVRSNARGKPFWLTEIQGGATSQGVTRGPVWRPQDVRTWAWLAVVAGAKGILYWAYHAEATGREAGGYGLLDRAGRDTERSREADRVWRQIRGHEAVILAYRPEPAVAVLYDPDSSLLDFAMEGNDWRVAESHRGYYAAIWEADCLAHYVRPEELPELDERLLIVPWNLIGKAETLAGIRAYLEGGGTVLLEARFGLFDERFFLNPIVPPDGLTELLGYEEEEPFFQAGDGPLGAAALAGPVHPLHAYPEIEIMAPVAGTFRAATYLAPFRVTDAVPVATCYGHAVGIRKRVGQGTAYAFGTNLGAAAARGEQTARAIVRALIGNAHQAEVTGQELRPRLVTSRHGALLVVFNRTASSLEESLQLREPSWTRARDIATGEVTPIHDRRLTISVPGEDVRVFALDGTGTAG